MSLDHADILENIKSTLLNRGIPHKDHGSDLSVLCPQCLHRDGKRKVKLGIHKKSLRYNCFRCGLKGSVFTLHKIFDAIGSPEATQFINTLLKDGDFWTFTENKKLVDILETFEEEIKDENHKASQFNTYQKIALDTIYDIKRASNVVDVCSTNIMKSYLQQRFFNPHELKFRGIPHFYGTNINHKLFCRVIIPTFLFTNYEARTIFPFAQQRYLKRSKGGEFILDYIFMHYGRNGRFVSPYHNVEALKHIRTLYVVEGVMDALRLGMQGLPVLSMGGFQNTCRVAFFLVMLMHMFNYKFDNVIYIYDNDLTMKQMKPNIGECSFTFAKYFKTDFFQFSFNEYKDIGEIKPEDMSSFVADIKAVS